VALSTFGSVLCGLAWNIGSLIDFRVVKGAAGVLVNPVAMTIVMRTAPP
jgi:MFS family permease